MSVITSVFQSCQPRRWYGRYSRIPGDKSVFHLTYFGGRMWPVIYWETDEGTGTCAACQCDAAEQLADAVELAKRRAGGRGGGSFIINEYGQVLVPASDGLGRRYLAGRLTGRVLFENPFDPDDLIDLGDDEHLQPGDPWKLPYVGFPFRLSKRNKIYAIRDDEDGRFVDFAPANDPVLIHSLRSIRGRYGSVKFIVNYCGLVVTKAEEHDWHPVFAGRINRNLWFTME